MALKNLVMGLAAALAVLTVSVDSRAQMADRNSAIPLPSQEQQEDLRKLGASVTRGSGPTISTSVEIMSVPEDSIFSVLTKNNIPVRPPLQSANELLILLDPRLRGVEIEEALGQYELDVIKTLPQIGAVVVDTSRRLGADALASTTKTVQAAKGSALGRLVEALSADKRFLSVAPNAVISSFQLRSALQPLPPPHMVAASVERADWGVADIRADQIWGFMTGSTKVGAVDVGFADHEDVQFEEAFPAAKQSHDHGNHVAGIMCAKHNGRGVKGVLKNCAVVYTVGARMLTGSFGVEGSGINPFVAQLSEYIATVLDFIDRRPEVRVINLSLGYNWMPNFGVDPRDPDAGTIRNDVRAQGRFFATVLAIAKRKDIAIVMAAGNDSSTLTRPLEADWASPFAFGSRLVEEADGWTNGVIVEAYGADHRRADFSNVGGHVACPGVEILSALASNNDAYGKMSGTSMASPYCAAGLAAILWLRPALGLREAIECMMSGPTKIDNRVPRLDLSYAVTQCMMPKRGL